MNTSSRFVEGEKVLCFHGPLLYEARCHKVDTEGEVDLYLIHYNGWNNKWDEWIPETRILKFNDVNLKKQQELIRHHKKSQSRGKNKKGKAPDLYEPEGEFSAKVSVQVELPDQLKHCLLDDWDLITQQKYLLQLPTTHTVTNILEEYRVYHSHELLKEGGGENTTSLEDREAMFEDREAVLEGIMGYFTRLLGMQLLYKFERPQYALILEQHRDKSVADIYGAEHLLRLFVKIGELLAFTELDNSAIELLQSHIHSLMDFIELHRERYLHTDNYIIAPPDYLRKAGV